MAEQYENNSISHYCSMANKFALTHYVEILNVFPKMTPLDSGSYYYATFRDLLLLYDQK